MLLTIPPLQSLAVCRWFGQWLRPLPSVRQRWHWLALALCLGGCSTLPMGTAQNERPTLQLSPQALPHAIEAVQRMQVRRQGQTRSLDAILEATPSQVQLAILQLSQTIAVLQWDGQALQTRLAPGWPAVIAPEKLLSDLQYVWWPYQAVAQALPEGWSLNEQAGLRQLQHEGQTVLRIQAQSLSASTAHIELIDPVAAYTVTLDVQGSIPSFATGTAASPPP